MQNKQREQILNPGKQLRNSIKTHKESSAECQLLFRDAHRRAARICNDFSVVGGVFSSQYYKTLELAGLEDFDKNRCYSDVQSLVTGESALAEEDRMQIVSIVTPNSFHYQQANIVLENNCHVVCDKPVTITSAEAEELGEIVARTGQVFCITQTYTSIQQPLSIDTNESLHR